MTRIEGSKHQVARGWHPISAAGIHAVDAGVHQLSELIPLLRKLARGRHEAVADFVADLDHLRHDAFLGEGGDGVAGIFKERLDQVRAWVLAQPVVDAFISTAVRNHADAQDILQDVAVAVLESNSRPPADAEFMAWAIGIARHKIADHFRRQKRQQIIMQEQVLEGVADAFVAQAEVWTAEGHALELCLESVKGDARHLLDLRYREGHTPQEIARQMGRTSEAIRALLLRVRRALRECIERRLSRDQALAPTGGG